VFEPQLQAGVDVAKPHQAVGAVDVPLPRPLRLPAAAFVTQAHQVGHGGAPQRQLEGGDPGLSVAACARRVEPVRSMCTVVVS